MRHKTFAFALAAILSFASISNAFALNCVQFVKSVSDIDISGNAWTWWDHAAGVYARGTAPREESVLVFKRTRHMPAGHVAVVSSVLNDRMVLIDQANWTSHRRDNRNVERGVAVKDCSSGHDWSAVCVWNDKYRVFGRPYPISGFIYPQAAQRTAQLERSR